MHISSISPNYRFEKNHYNQHIQKQQNHVFFGAAKDLHLKYILKKRAHLLPERILEKVTEIVNSHNGSVIELPTLKRVHDEEYAQLMKADTLAKAKESYKEFKDVIDLSKITTPSNKQARKITEVLPLEEFSLDLLKRVWAGTTQVQIAKHYGLNGREAVAKLCKMLNIPKPESNYLILLKTCEEEGNRKVAEATLQHLDICKRNLALAGKTSKTPEAIQKQRQSLKEFYNDHPERREEASTISKEVWRRCEEIRSAKMLYLSQQPLFVQHATSKLIHNQKMTETEKRVAHAFHRDFWEIDPARKIQYGQTRHEVVEDFKDGKLTPDIKNSAE